MVALLPTITAAFKWNNTSEYLVLPLEQAKSIFSFHFWMNKQIILLFLLILNSQRTSGSVILEENTDEFWSSNDQSIPNMNSYRATCSSSLSLPIQQQNQYGDVTSQTRRNESPLSTYSPYSNSPVVEPTNSGYMMMSPAIDYKKWVTLTTHI